LTQAHEIAHGRWSTHIRDEFGADVEVDTHIEPLEPELPHGTDAAADRRRGDCASLVALRRRRAIHDIHNVRVRDNRGWRNRQLPLPCSPLDERHQGARERRRDRTRAAPRVPSVKRVISHAEPPYAD